MRNWGQLLPNRSTSRGHCPFSESSPERATEPAGGHPIGNSIYLAHIVCSILVITWGSVPHKFWVHPSCFQCLFHTPGLYCSMLQIFLNSLKQAGYGFSKLHTSCLVVPGMALAATGLSSQHAFSWVPPSPAQVAAICRLLYSLCCVPLVRTLLVADHRHANSNQGSTTTGGCIQPPWGCTLSTQLG